MSKYFYFFIIMLHLLITPSLHTKQSNDSDTNCTHLNTIADTNQFIISTLYGDFTVIEPVLIELFNSSTMERIKHVRQYGAEDYVIKQIKEYTRYEHCVGVWALLRMYGASLEEQVAGLLHDTSHTVFSHVGDVLFKHKSMLFSYQDTIHQWYLQHQNIDSLLADYNIPFDAICNHHKHSMLEQNLPDICADRLEYNLHAGILTNMLTADDIKIILNDLMYHEGCWFFVTKESAKKLALVSLFNTEFVWASPAAQYITQCIADALERALSIKLLTHDDIHFSTDDIVWNTLLTSDDPIIVQSIDNIMNHTQDNRITTYQKKQPLIQKKFRGLDPLIKEENELKRLTDIDNKYKKEYNRVKTLVEQSL